MADKATVELETAQLLTKCRGVSQRCATYANRLIGENDSLGVEISSIEQALKKAEEDARASRSIIALENIRLAKDVLRQGPGGDLRKFSRQRLPLMLQLLFGSKVNVVTYRSDQSIAMKEQYYRFRDRSAIIMLVWACLLAFGMARASAVREKQHQGHTFAPGLMTGVQLYLTWLCYFYLALSLRENVLMVNGSHIKGWWIQHHYWSCACSLIMLGLPVYSPAVFLFCQRFMVWSCFQALVMMVQNHYQRRRMYTRIALGKNSAMDVVAGESSGSSGQLLLLYPMLFILQGWQAVIGVVVAGYTLPSWLTAEGLLDVEKHESDLRGMRGVFVVGIIFTYMAFNNFTATVRTLLEKRIYAKRHSKLTCRSSK
jgi:hypothetical protein